MRGIFFGRLNAARNRLSDLPKGRLKAISDGLFFLYPL